MRKSLIFVLALILVSACSSRYETQPLVDDPGAESRSGKTEDIICISDEIMTRELDQMAELQEVAPDGSLMLDAADPPEICITNPIELTPEEQQALDYQPQIQFDLDLRETKEVELYFSYYTHTHRKSFERWLKRAEAYLPYVREYFIEQGLPQDLIFLPFAESGYNPLAYSRAGAAGLWQFIPGTGKMYGLTVDWWLDERRDPYKSTRAAAAYLKKLHDQFGDWYLALAGYNAGEGKVARAIRSTGSSDFFDIAQSRKYFKQETRHYVPKLLAILKIVRNLESLGFDPIDWDAAHDQDILEVRGGTDLMALASACGLSWDEFKDHNPAFKRMVSPPDRICPVYLPQGKLELAQAYLEKPESRPYAGYQRYRIRSGDSWWRIANRFGLPVSALKQVNNTSSNLLRPGQWVMIPAPGSAATVALADSDQPLPNGSTHVVRRGDTLWEIARRYGVSTSELQQANAIGNGEILGIGRTLEIPGRGTPARTRVIATKRANYVVRPGDTLWEIARRFQVDLDTLVAANGLQTGRHLKVGQKLYIPDYSAQAAAKSQADAKRIRDRLVKYQVRKGDSLWSIARKFGVTTSELQAWNDISASTRIYPGDDLQVYVP